MDECPSEELERVPACPVCLSERRELLHDRLVDGAFAIASGEWTLMRCLGCGSAYLDPRPTKDAAAHAYSGGYQTHARPCPEPPPRGPIGTIRRAVRNGYANARFGLELEPATERGGSLVPLMPPLRAATERYFRHLRLPHRGARLLDVGCGNGEFVLRAQAIGWRAAGIDVDAEAVSWGRAAGLGLERRTIEEEAERTPGTWHSVTASHVLEHVHDPGSFLAAARRLLRSDGVLWIATPNLHSAGHERFGRAWLGLDPPRHLVLFTRDSLQRAVRDAGLSELAWPSPWSTGGAIRVRSNLIRHGRRPTHEEQGPLWPDLLGLVRPRRAEEIVLVARVAVS